MHGLTYRTGPALLAAACVSLLMPERTGAAGVTNTVTFDRTDRVLILAPHPDDEVIACGGVIQRCRDAGIATRVVFFTYGDNNEWSFLVYRKHAVLLPEAVREMGLVRHEEALSAALSLGLPVTNLAFLGYPDFGTQHIWLEHWKPAAPFKSMLTRVDHVPYDNALRPGAAYRGDEIMRDLASVFTGFRPTKVFVSHPADFNVDHRALYLFTRTTLWTLEKQLTPEVYPYLVHFPKWPHPRGLRPDLPLTPPPFLESQVAWKTLVLTTNEVAAKTAAIHRHLTQYEYAANYLGSFMRQNETFGEFAPIGFATNGPASTASRAAKYADGEVDHLTEVERAAFVGVEMHRIEAAPDHLAISITLSRPLAETVLTDVQICGFRQDTAFADMPKVRVEIGWVKHTVSDRNRTLPATAVSVMRNRREIDVNVPWSRLGDPERLWVSARTYLGDIPLDWGSWRMVDLRRN